MFSIPDFLDRAQRGAGVSSDYALAKITGLKTTALSNYRTERTSPDERAIVALCKLSGDDPEHVAACIQSMRAANDDAAGLWRRVAERLKGGVGVAVVAILVAIGVGDLTSTKAYAAGASLYIMSNALWRLICRLASRTYRRVPLA